MSDNQAKVAAKTAAAANARAVYKQECVMYENERKRQDKKNARLLDMYKLQSANAERSGRSPPPPPNFDERDLQAPMVPACMRHVEQSSDSEAEHDIVPETQGSPVDEEAMKGPHDQSFHERFNLDSD